MGHGMRGWRLTVLGVTLTAAVPSAQYRTLDDHFAPPAVTSKAAWDARAGWLREHVLASAGLLPLPEKTPLGPEIFGEIVHDDYRVAKVYFESLPGFFVTGNLYRPIGAGPFPAILSPHGHWAYGRLENTDINSVPGRAINLARQGFVVFTYDMIGYNDSRQLPHTFDGRRERLWGLSLGGLQLWNSIRALDFLETLPEVRRDAIGATGESGGGTQTFLVAAVDRRIQVAAPVEHDLAAHAGRLPVREPSRSAAGCHQRRDRRDDRAAAAADGFRDRRLDPGDAQGGVSGDAPHLRTLRRRHAGRGGPVRRAAQLQPRQPRGDVRMDGALAPARAGRREASRAVVHCRPAPRFAGLSSAPAARPVPSPRRN